MLVPAVAVLAGCAAAPAGDGGRASAERTYAAVAMVLESPEHGPQLCLGGVLESLPPQCGGPDVVGWDWSAVEDEESGNGTTWGEWRVVGTWDGEALTLTERPTVPPPRRMPGEDPGAQFATPCPTPDGGWPVLDPSTATEEGFAAASAYAEHQPDLGGAWVDAQAELAEPLPEVAQPAVLNVTFVSDVERHERELRARYGGPLCVSAADRSAAELQRLQGEVQEELGDAVLSTSEDVVRGTVSVQVVVADEQTLARVREIDPDGVVEVHGALEPVP